MTDQHLIAPPTELIQAWLAAPRFTSPPKDGTFVVQKCHSLSNSEIVALATEAARWGYEQRGADIEAKLQKARDEELEACCEEMKSIPSPLGIPFGEMASNALRNARRPKTKSQAEKVLASLDGVALPEDAWQAVQAALKRLQELEALDD